jgi:hypothetical protein
MIYSDSPLAHHLLSGILEARPGMRKVLRLRFLLSFVPQYPLAGLPIWPAQGLTPASRFYLQPSAIVS